MQSNRRLQQIKKRMGNDVSVIKTQNNNEESSLLTSTPQQNNIGQNHKIVEQLQYQGQKCVVQKEILRKSNVIKSKVDQIQNQIRQPSKPQAFKRTLQLKPTFTKTLFDKEKIKKIQYKVVQEQTILSCDLTCCQQDKQNIDIEHFQNQTPIFKPIMISQETILKVKQMKINQKYHFQEIIGEGGFGIVYKAQCLLTKQVRAIKVLSQNDTTPFQKRLIMNEVTLISRLDHPNIIRVYQILEYDSSYFIVTEYCEGGSLRQHLKVAKPTNKQAFAKRILYKLLSALKYIHSKHIMHRDIKVQNLVFRKVLIKGKEEIVVKLIDFGLAVEFNDKNAVKSQKIIGTPQYLSPENSKGVYSPKSDIWCCGVILYFLLAGQYPFKGDTKTQIMTKVKTERLNFGYSQWNDFTKDAKDLLRKLLSKNLQHRVSADEALRHRWFDEYLKRQHTILQKSCENGCQIAGQLLRFRRCNNLITYLDSYTILTKLNEQQRQKLIAYFNLIDKDRNGVLELSELRDYFACNNIRLSQIDLKNLFSKLDLNNSKTIYLNEFIYGTINVQKYYEKGHMHELFELIDANKDGLIDKHQLRSLLQQCNTQEIDFFMRNICKEAKQKINFDDFKDYIRVTPRRKTNLYS